MLTSDKMRKAFDLSKEPKGVRERYGMHAYGQRGLMARRLVEAGAPVCRDGLGESLPRHAEPEGLLLQLGQSRGELPTSSTTPADVSRSMNRPSQP